MKKKTEQQILEAYGHIKPYLKEQEELNELCSSCEGYCGNEHDYNDCVDKICFKMFLALTYLDWINSF